MRNTIKNHNDFIAGDNDPVAKSPYFLIRAKPAKFADDARVGFTATKKTFRFAVQRNRAKRLLRDWVAFNEKLMAREYDYIFIARGAILNATRTDGREAMRKALRYIQRAYAPKKISLENVTE